MEAPFMTALADLMYYIESNRDMLVNDIASGEFNHEVNIPQGLRECLQKELTPDPERAKVLRTEFDRGFETPILPRIWKNLQYISSVGSGGFAVYTQRMRRYAGDTPMYFAAYAASEALVALATEM